jgi:peptide/nickel transport system substrate-binding protein
LKDVPVGDLPKHEFSRNPVGTGPYSFVSWKSNEALVFKYFPDYFGQKGLPSQVVWRVLPDAATRQAELKAGGIHYMTDVPYDQFDALGRDPSFEAIAYKGISFYYLGYDLTKPMFQDKRVRQAITMAIDRQAIVTKLLAGKGEVAHSYFFPGSWTYNPNVKKLPYDVNRAKELLAEAGWTPGGDGILEKDGEKLSFRYVVAQEIDNQLAIVVQQSLKAVGIDAKVERMDFNQMLSTYYQKGKFEGLGLSWGSGFFGDPVNGLATMFGSEQNRFGYSNPQLDELLVKAGTTLDQQERKLIFDQIGEILSEEQPLTFLVWPDELAARSKKVELPTMPTLLSAFHSVPRWQVTR